MATRAFDCLFLILSFAPLSAWKNPRKSDTLNMPVFGTDDWIAFKCEFAGCGAYKKGSSNQ
jgi:hypothetical protein